MRGKRCCCRAQTYIGCCSLAPVALVRSSFWQTSPATASPPPPWCPPLLSNACPTVAAHTLCAVRCYLSVRTQPCALLLLVMHHMWGCTSVWSMCRHAGAPNMPVRTDQSGWAVEPRRCSLPVCVCNPGVLTVCARRAAASIAASAGTVCHGVPRAAWHTTCWELSGHVAARQVGLPLWEWFPLSSTPRCGC